MCGFSLGKVCENPHVQVPYTLSNLVTNPPLLRFSIELIFKQNIDEQIWFSLSTEEVQISGQNTRSSECLHRCVVGGNAMYCNQ